MFGIFLVHPHTLRASIDLEVPKQRWFNTARAARLNQGPPHFLSPLALGLNVFEVKYLLISRRQSLPLYDNFKADFF